MYGKIVKIWESIKIASTTLKIKTAYISCCCRGGIYSSGNFLWEYNNTDRHEKYENKIKNLRKRITSKKYK